MDRTLKLTNTYIVGGTQKPYSFTDIQYVVDSFSMHTKAEGMTQFDIFHVFVENLVNSELCFF